MTATPHALAQLHRTRLSSDDFREAAEYLGKARETADDVVRRGLLTAAIVCYARPFTTSRKRSSPDATSQLSVNPSKLFSEEELQLHERLMSLRNEVVAHTEYKRKPVKRLEGSLAGFTMSGKSFDLLHETVDVDLFLSICRVLDAHCFSKLMELNKKVVEAENG